jgi:hypothetical protein
VIQFMSDVADYVFGCRHKALSRVFTIGRGTYKVCCDCGAEFECSLRTMSAKRRAGTWPFARDVNAEIGFLRLMHRNCFGRLISLHEGL